MFDISLNSAMILITFFLVCLAGVVLVRDKVSKDRDKNEKDS
jgi:amino acid transporter